MCSVVLFALCNFRLLSFRFACLCRDPRKSRPNPNPKMIKKNNASPSTDGLQELSLLSLEPKHWILGRQKPEQIKSQHPKYDHSTLFLCLDGKIVCYLKKDKNVMKLHTAGSLLRCTAMAWGGKVCYKKRLKLSAS